MAYIPDEARSDAAVVALACDQVVMGPDAVLGGPGDDELSADEIDRRSARRSASEPRPSRAPGRCRRR